ncbi:conserved hypothetical protein [Beutenbergia cavernae DSM 12333]|uniref:Transmembrane protein n=1 Tax=Beutenbergia cavernae (strain ATCC BAA-8 / DSM 12333 / CCUG 43141 / JCM 11478 / NBRC 16432 / NCIMB 13614 / HKI 0122) TaxID=471853 RepID=C5BW72_BEUC1|nr:DUF3040 domain-containing protein [Beutenbergia cavernae]ACQ80673.1 conserved hypothetical protein [Beutenbergia cavernae DSM 12333]
MPLSEYEQRVLEQMERQLRSDDPKLAQSFSRRGSRTSRILGGTLLVIAGLGMLVGGVAGSMTWLGVVGFLAMFGGVLLAMSSGRHQAAAAPTTDAPRATPAAGRPPRRSSFMQRLEERWDRRRREGGR